MPSACSLLFEAELAVGRFEDWNLLAERVRMLTAKNREVVAIIFAWRAKHQLQEREDKSASVKVLQTGPRSSLFATIAKSKIGHN
jgi:hypothetical protein